MMTKCNRLATTILFLFLLVYGVSAQEWCGINNLYFQNSSSGIDGFDELANYASGAPLLDTNVTITDSDGIVPIGAYISNQGTPGNGVTLEMGLRQYNIYDYASSVASPSYFAINVSKYDTTTNTETFFYNISSVAISSVSSTRDMTPYVSQRKTTFNGNERVLIRIGAYTTRNSATTIHFLNQGNMPTYVQSGFFDCPPQPQVVVIQPRAAIPIYTAIIAIAFLVFVIKKKKIK